MHVSLYVLIIIHQTITNSFSYQFEINKTILNYQLSFKRFRKKIISRLILFLKKDKNIFLLILNRKTSKKLLSNHVSFKTTLKKKLIY